MKLGLVIFFIYYYLKYKIVVIFLLSFEWFVIDLIIRYYIMMSTCFGLLWFQRWTLSLWFQSDIFVVYFYCFKSRHLQISNFLPFVVVLSINLLLEAQIKALNKDDPLMVETKIFSYVELKKWHERLLLVCKDVINGA